MFEARFQTYWADVDAAGIVYFPHFFRFVEQAEGSCSGLPEKNWCI
jgi:acyl-CoA thioesterase FadM